MNKFKVIVITHPGEVEMESLKISRLLESGVDYVHIRKPGMSLRDVRNIIEDIPYPQRCRLKLHGHFALLDEMNLGGVHLNSRCPVAPATAALRSRSCHSIAEIEECRLHSPQYEYLTLSPIYDSISKPGYQAAFNHDTLHGHIRGRRVVALGGVTPDRFKELAEKGFYGAALLGYIWEGDFESRIQELRTVIELINA